jgi:hypothetical protein
MNAVATPGNRRELRGAVAEFAEDLGIFASGRNSRRGPGLA